MHAQYISECFNRKEQDKTIRQIKELIKKYNLEFDGFVVTGVSGIVMGSILSRILRKDLVVVRKDKDGSHSSFSVENYKTSRKYIFLDDFTCTGKTFRRVESKLDEAFDYLKGYWAYPFDKKFDKKSEIIGKLLYSGTPMYFTVEKPVSQTILLKRKNKALEQLLENI